MHMEPMSIQEHRQYKIIIEPHCKVLSKKELFVKAFKCLPPDAILVDAEFTNNLGGYLKFTTMHNINNISVGQSVHFRISETVELAPNKQQ